MLMPLGFFRILPRSEKRFRSRRHPTEQKEMMAAKIAPERKKDPEERPLPPVLSADAAGNQSIRNADIVPRTSACILDLHGLGRALADKRRRTVRRTAGFARGPDLLRCPHIRLREPDPLS